MDAWNRGLGLKMMAKNLQEQTIGEYSYMYTGNLAAMQLGREMLVEEQEGNGMADML